MKSYQLILSPTFWSFLPLKASINCVYNFKSSFVIFGSFASFRNNRAKNTFYNFSDVCDSRPPRQFFSQQAGNQCSFSHHVGPKTNDSHVRKGHNF